MKREIIDRTPRCQTLRPAVWNNRPIIESLLARHLLILPPAIICAGDLSMERTCNHCKKPIALNERAALFYGKQYHASPKPCWRNVFESDDERETTSQPRGSQDQVTAHEKSMRLFVAATTTRP